MDSLEDLYRSVCNTPSEIFKHCPTLYDLASNCEHITEFGLNTLASLVSFLAAEPKKIVAYGQVEDRADKFSKLLNPIKNKTQLYLRQGNSLELNIEATDMLFVDSYHTYTHLKNELTRHAHKVKKYLVFHDTHSFGMRGEDGSSPGITNAISEFVDTHCDWKVVHNSRVNNGLMVLERTPADGPNFETTYTMVTFDIPEVRWVERFPIGTPHPYKGLTETEATQQLDKLNRALRYGIIIAVERNLVTVKVGDAEIDSWYVVYHVGFRNRPPGK